MRIKTHSQKFLRPKSLSCQEEPNLSRETVSLIYRSSNHALWWCCHKGDTSAFYQQCWETFPLLSRLAPKPLTTGETDREAQAHTAIVFLAPLEKYFAALGPNSLAPLSKLKDKDKYLQKNIRAHHCFCGLVVECWAGSLVIWRKQVQS